MAPGPTQDEKEDKPLTAMSPRERAHQNLKAFGLGVATIVTSACLIAFNKYLIHKGRFPYATPLMVCHMLVSATLSCILYLCFPSMYPSLSDPEKRKQINAGIYLKGIIPIGAFFVGQLVLSNTAYLYSTVAFLQMMKESNIVLVYLLSIAFALEAFRLRNAAVLVLIVVATFLTIKGELHFSIVGFGVQGCSQICESLKIVLQGVLLSGSGVKLDALSYVLLMTPVSFTFLGALLAVLYGVHWHAMPTPSWDEYVQWWPMLLANACVAFTLNVIAALFMKSSSPIAYILAGIVKDACIVLAGAVVLGEAIGTLQGFGFALQLSLILLWMLMKSLPEHFEDGVLAGLRTLLTHGLQAPQKKAG